MSPKLRKKNSSYVKYEIERILNKRTTKSGKIQYFLKWRGHPHSKSTWEPKENLNCPKLIKAYEDALKRKCPKNKRNLKKVRTRKEKIYVKRKKTRLRNVKFEVEKILKKRRTVGGNIYYYIKWKKLTKSYNSWEHIENLDCPELIEAYENLLKSKRLAKKRKRTIRNNTATESVSRKEISKNYSTDAALNIDTLPEDVLLEIFSYCTQNDLGKFSQVCKKWNICIKNPILWKNVDVSFRWNGGYINEVLSIFSENLPTCLTSIILNFKDPIIWKDRLHFEEFCMYLRKRSPSIQTLTLISTKISVRLQSAIDICAHILPDLEVLAFRNCRFGEHIFQGDRSDTSKIKTLDLHSSLCGTRDLRNVTFSKMPYLRKLNLNSTNAIDVWLYDISLLSKLEVLDVGWTKNPSVLLKTLQENARNLTELYLCQTKAFENDILDLELPQLNTICLCKTNVDSDDILLLIELCPALYTIYVDEEDAEAFIAYLVLNGCAQNSIKGVTLCEHRVF